MKRRTAFLGFSEGAHTEAFSVMALILRLTMGILFFYAGWSKFTAGDWSATEHLAGANGLFASWFQSLSGSIFVDQLNMWGLLLIGFLLLLGLCVRTASFFGILFMAFYYFSYFETNTAHGFIDEHVVYTVIFGLFLAGGFGHIWGLDALIEKQLSKKQAWLKIFFG
jgi:thiosulfate dehydrogenase (quinone) large subunit